MPSSMATFQNRATGRLASHRRWRWHRGVAKKDKINTTPKTKQDAQERYDSALKILSGLLASGHYTFDAEDNCDTKCFITNDNGKDWQEFSTRKHGAIAVEDALLLADELFDEVWNSPLK